MRRSRLRSFWCGGCRGCVGPGMGGLYQAVRLAALSWPEQVITTDVGERHEWVKGGG